MDHQANAPIAKNNPVAEARLRQGLVTIFTGEGRGKTTAAIGTALRATGHGLRVLVVLFMKGADFVHGEAVALKAIDNITLQSFGAPGWVIPDRDNTAHKIKAAEALAFAADQIASGSYDLAVLDEVISAVHFGILPHQDVLQFIKTKPSGLEIILTGHGASAELMEFADLVTEMKNLKHPFEHGVKARVGIDY